MRFCIAHTLHNVVFSLYGCFSRHTLYSVLNLSVCFIFFVVLLFTRLSSIWCLIVCSTTVAIVCALSTPRLMLHTQIHRHRCFCRSGWQLLMCKVLLTCCRICIMQDADLSANRKKKCFCNSAIRSNVIFLLINFVRLCTMIYGKHHCWTW